MDKQDTKLDVEVNTSEECSSTLSSLKTVTNGARKAPCENGGVFNFKHRKSMKARRYTVLYQLKCVH